jgi:hypothetical protein
VQWLDVVELGKKPNLAAADEFGNTGHDDGIGAIRGQIGSFDDPLGITDLHPQTRGKCLLCGYRAACCAHALQPLHDS